MIPKIVNLLSITFTLGNAKIPKTKAVIPIIASNKTGTKNVWTSSLWTKPNTNTNSNTSSNKISADKAKKIALNHANLTSNQVSYVQVEADFDDYTPSYDVEFYHNNVEYSYEINANNGNIISFEKDID